MALRFDNLSLTLRGRPVLDDVSGALAQGKVTVILGANGAGKSSLLACLAGLRAPDAGRITLDGRHLAAIPPRERAQTIGLLPQRAEIHWDVEVETLVGLGRLSHRGRWGESEADRAAVSRAMAATDIAHLARRNVQRLSGGEQGRVLLARVLAGEPRWLLADEPLASLDPAHQLDTLDRLRAAADAGAGVAVVLHDLTLAARAADDLIVMKQGRILAAGPRDDVLTADVLADAYGVAVDIGRCVAGLPVITPMRRV